MTKRKTGGLGRALDSADEELDLLALVTPEDVEDARAIAAQRMRPRGRSLLEAQKPRPLEGEEGDDAIPVGA